MKHLIARWLISIYSLLLVSLASYSPAHAAGLLRYAAEDRFYSLVSAELNIAIEKQVATTQIVQTFQVDLPAASVMYLFPVPEQATVANFEIWQDGAWKAADIRGQQQDTLKGSASSTLTNYLGMNPFRIAFSCPERSCKVRLTFVELLPYEQGKVSYRYPLAPYAQGHRAVVMKLHVSLKLGRAIAEWVSESHKGFSIDKQSAQHWTLQTTLTPAQQEKNLHMYYRAVQDKLSLHFYTHRNATWETANTENSAMFRDGYFLLMFEPKEDISQQEIIPKTFTLVIDISGSMSGLKIEQAIKAALRCIDGLHDQDFFNIISFSSGAQRFEHRAVSATRGNRERARAFINSLKAGGGTNIEEALRSALDQGNHDSERPHLIIFLTDGMASAGETSPAGIVASVRKHNTQKARVFAFGIGASYNRALLEDIAHETKGQASELDPTKIDVLLQKFFQSINSPVLTDVQITLGNSKLSQITPALTQLPFVYLGSQLLVLGRYSDFGSHTIRITGKVGSKDVSYTLNVSYPKHDLSNAFLPKIWAKAYTADLYREYLRSQSKDDGLAKQITSLGLLYRIQTPFTSFGYSGGADNKQDQQQRKYAGSYSGGGGGGYPNANVGPMVAGCSCSGQQETPRSLWFFVCLIGLGLFGLRRSGNMVRSFGER